MEDVLAYVESMGLCIASNMITVDEYPVGYMYREEPSNEMDSGWRFLSGCEDDEYSDNTDNHHMHDVITIATCDPSIIPYLDAGVSMAYEKAPGLNDFELIED